MRTRAMAKSWRPAGILSIDLHQLPRTAWLIAYRQCGKGEDEGDFSVAGAGHRVASRRCNCPVRAGVAELEGLPRLPRHRRKENGTSAEGGGGEIQGGRSQADRGAQGGQGPPPEGGRYL